MIDKQKGLYEVECDGCSAVLVTGTSDFRTVIEYLREKKWRSIKSDDDVWENYCPECMSMVAKSGK